MRKWLGKMGHTWLHGNPIITNPLSPYFSWRAWSSVYWGVNPVDQYSIYDPLNGPLWFMIGRDKGPWERPTTLWSYIDEQQGLILVFAQGNLGLGEFNLVISPVSFYSKRHTEWE
jgi:hypothetical protein